MKWDGIEYENYWGLNLHKTNDNQCPNDDKYFFELHVFGYDLYDLVIIKNKASNKNISIFSDYTFALTYDMKDLYPSNFLTLIISNDSSITMRSWLSAWENIFKYIYMGNTHSLILRTSP